MEAVDRLRQLLLLPRSPIEPGSPASWATVEATLKLGLRPDERRTFPSLTAFIVGATADLRDRFVWLSNDRVLLRREVAALRRSAGGPGG